jgi:translation initiation factor IF-3
VVEVRLIGPNNENIGVVPIQEALKIARAADKDLVEVGATANPPVCRVLDYGKFLYERTKKDKEARKAQKIVEIKEIQIRPKSTDFHNGLKVKDARRWLEEGKKVRVRVKFRGREITYPDIAKKDLLEIATELSDVSSIEAQPIMEGRAMIMLLTPGAKKPAKGAGLKPERSEPQPTGGTA